MGKVTAGDVLWLLDLLERKAASIWVDGGWGVDALLTEQTRIHADLDIVVSEQDLSTVVDALEGSGFSRMPTKDDKPWNFVLSDSQGREVDIHVVGFDEGGDGIHGPVENGDRYPRNRFWEGVKSRVVTCVVSRQSGKSVSIRDTSGTAMTSGMSARLRRGFVWRCPAILGSDGGDGRENRGDGSDLGGRAAR